MKSHVTKATCIEEIIYFGICLQFQMLVCVHDGNLQVNIVLEEEQRVLNLKNQQRLWARSESGLLKSKSPSPVIHFHQQAMPSNPSNPPNPIKEFN